MAQGVSSEDTEQEYAGEDGLRVGAPNLPLEDFAGTQVARLKPKQFIGILSR